MTQPRLRNYLVSGNVKSIESEFSKSSTWRHVCIRGFGDAPFFRALGHRVRDIRKRKGLSQEDMISFGFSARHWQQIEAGRPITVKTLLRMCKAFEVPLVRLVRGLDQEIRYKV